VRRLAWNPWSLFIGVVLFAAAAWINVFPITDPDTWWHLKTGELIWKTWTIPRTDPFSYTIPGQPWVTFEWLSQVLMYAAYAAGGAAALTGFKALIVALSFLVFFRLGRGGFWAGLLLCAAAYAGGAFAERPQAFDILFLGLLLQWLDDDGKKGPAWGRLIALHVLWANLHGGAALLGVAVVGLKATVSLIKRGARAKETQVWSLAALACAACLVINPHGLVLFSHLRQTMLFPGRDLINDWKPLPTLLNRHGPIFLIGFAAAVVSWSEDPLLCLLVAALGAMALSAARYVSNFEIAGAALAARYLERRLPVRSGALQTAIVALAAVLLCGQTRTIGLLEHPEWAVSFLDKAGIQGRMFNEYNLGGYLIWKTYPQRRVFVDGRNVEYGADFIRQAAHWYEPEVWPSLDGRWRFDYAVIDNSVDYRAQVLDGSPDWALAFWDDACLVYLRREPANAEAIRLYGYQFLRPNEQSYSYLEPVFRDKKKAPILLAELQRAIDESPQNDNAHQMKAYALTELGRPREALPELQIAGRQSPLRPGPLLSLAWWYVQAGNAAAARQSYTEALILARRLEDPTSLAAVYDGMGMMEARFGNRSEAVRLFKKSLDIQPGYAEALNHLRPLESTPAQQAQ
jgi:tetratricopeptide (TPR) repeat protein